MEQTRTKKKKRKRSILIGAGVVVAGLVVWLWPFLPKIPALIDLYVFNRKRTFDGETSMENLREIGRALSLYVESEGAFPPKDKWMDNLLLYMRADDMTKEEQIKKFRAPGVGETEFGYAFNGEITTKWASEIEAPGETPVIYDSSKLGRNAHDAEALESLPEPPRQGGNFVLWVDGNVTAAPRRQ